MLKRILSFLLATLVLFNGSIAALALPQSQTTPPEIQQYAQPGETVTALRPVVINNQKYLIYYFHTGKFDDGVGAIFYSDPSNRFSNLVGQWQRQEIQGILVTDTSYRPVRDEAILRHVFLTEMAGYMTTQLADIPEPVSVDQGIVDMMYSLTRNPIYSAAFIFQRTQSDFAVLFQGEEQEYVEALRLFLATPDQDTELVNEFDTEVKDKIEAGLDLKDAIEETIKLAKFSNSRSIRQIAQGAQETFDELTKFTIKIKGQSFTLPLETILDLFSLGISVIYVETLSSERADMLADFANYVRQNNISVSPTVLSAIDTVVLEAQDANRQRVNLITDFIFEKAGDLAVSRGKEALVNMWKNWAWKEFGKRTTGHIVAGAASQVLLAYSLANLLFGYDSIYENTIVGQRTAELIPEFDNVMNWIRAHAPAQKDTYDAVPNDIYRTAFFFKNLAASQLYRSNADMLKGARAIKNIGDFISGGFWTEAEQGYREWADEYALAAEVAALRPPIIDYAIELALARAKLTPEESTPEEQSLSSATVLVLDISGSMSETWQGGVKIESAKNAANDVINMIDQESQVGEIEHQVAIATFSTQATLNLGLTIDYETAHQVVNGRVPTDRTNIGAGLQVANQALASAPGTAQKIIILLSDGLSNEGLEKEQILSGPVREAADAGTCIYTVGFGETGELDEDLLRRIASESGCGEYHYVDASETLAFIYARLRHESLGVVLDEFEGQIRQDETLEVGEVTVPSDQGELYITLQWPGSDLDLIVKDPLGNEISERYPGVSYEKHERLVYLIVKDPLPGPWVLSAFGVDVPEGILTYHAIASVREGAKPTNTSQSPSTNTGLIVLGMGFGALFIFAIVMITRRRPAVAGGPQIRSGSMFRRGKLVIGRDPRCEVVLADQHVSAQHVVIQQTPQGYVLTDQGSINGTYVNGQRVQQVLLRGGETVRVGQTALRFNADGSVVPAQGNSVGGTTVHSSQSAGQTAYLAVMVGAQEFSRVAIVPGTILGRCPECPVDLNADALISRQHARLDYQGEQWGVSDLNSRTGTHVNGQPVRQQALRHGDEIRVGNTRLRFYLQ